MSSNGNKLSARERRDANARVNASIKMLQRARMSSSLPRADSTTTTAPKSRRPELERNVTVTTNRRPEPSPRRRDDARKKDDVTKLGRKRPREDSRKKSNLRDLFGSNGMSAPHLSKIIFPEANFPHANEMLQKDAYMNMALHCMMFLASVNQLTINYEETALSQGRQLTSAQRACDEHKRIKRVVQAQVASLEVGLKDTDDKRRYIDDTFSESESERKLLKRAVSYLNARLKDASTLQNEVVQQAVDQAKSELVAKYEAKLDRAKDKLKMLNDQPRVNIIDLAQVQSNIEFVKLLRSDKAPDLGEEITALKEQEAGLLLADEEFAEHVRELEEILGSSGSDKESFNERGSSWTSCGSD